MASRFAVGVAVGLGGSFAILQRTTDRRIISLMRIDDEQKSASIYKYRLYREMSDFARPIKEGATEKKMKGIWNSGVSSVSSIFNSIGNILPGSVKKQGEDEGNKGPGE